MIEGGVDMQDQPEVVKLRVLKSEVIDFFILCYD